MLGVPGVGGGEKKEEKDGFVLVGDVRIPVSVSDNMG